MTIANDVPNVKFYILRKLQQLNCCLAVTLEFPSKGKPKSSTFGQVSTTSIILQYLTEGFFH